MLCFSSPLVGPMFDYSSFNSKRWDWANVENLSEPNLWIIKTFPCLFLQSPFFLCNLYSETYWHILLLSWFGWWGGSGKIDREESSLRSWNNKSCGWPARYPNQESDHHPNNQFWNFTKIVDLFIHWDHWKNVYTSISYLQMALKRMNEENGSPVQRWKIDHSQL